MEAPFPRRRCERIVSAGEVIEADGFIARRGEGIEGGTRLREACLGARKRALRDQPLMRLEPGNVRITEQSNAARRQRQRARDRPL